jgi:hypothetical protein
VSPSRRIYKSVRHANHEARDLVEAVFASELLQPSDKLWLVSPWISDLAVIDNTAAAFSGLEPDWGARLVPLSEVLARIVGLGGSITVVTRPDDLNLPFLQAIRSRTSDHLANGRLRLIERDRLHEKGILGGHFHLAGSMNLTFLGVEINDECLIYETDPDVVARARRDYEVRYGGSD